MRIPHEWFALRPATSADVEAISRLWTEASSWLRDHGRDQWQYPPNRERILADVAAGTAYVAVRDFVRDEKPPFATITLDAQADPEFWTADDRPGDALYVHRTIVDPHLHGHRFGAALLDWASRRAHRAGRQWLRLDAWATNEALQAYYRREGFAHVRTVDLPHRRSGALFQREAGNEFHRGPYLHDVELPMHDMNGNPINEGARGATGY